MILLLTFSSLERNSHIGIAEPVTRIVTQQPSRMQVVTFAIRVLLVIIIIIIVRAYSSSSLFTYSWHSLHANRCANHAQLPLSRLLPNNQQQALSHKSCSDRPSGTHWAPVSFAASFYVDMRISVATTRLRVPPLYSCIRISCIRQYEEQSPRGPERYLRALGNHADATQICKKKAFLNFIRRRAEIPTPETRAESMKTS